MSENDATDAAARPSYTQELEAINARLTTLEGDVKAILAAVIGAPVPPTPTPTPTPPGPPAKVQAVVWLNESQGDVSDDQLRRIVDALNLQETTLASFWPKHEPVTHVFWPDAQTVPADAWPIYLLPDPDLAGALGYHDVDQQGRPYGRVFTRWQGKAWPALVPGPDGLSVSNIASHEAGEAAIDPDVVQTATAPNGDVWALEVGDPVESYTYAETLPDGTVVWLSDLVGAAFFGEGDGPVDIMGEARPFTISPGGYAIVNDKQVFASEPSLRYLSQQGSPAGRTVRRLAAVSHPQEPRQDK